MGPPGPYFLEFLQQHPDRCPSGTQAASERLKTIKVRSAAHVGLCVDTVFWQLACTILPGTTRKVARTSTIARKLPFATPVSGPRSAGHYPTKVGQTWSTVVGRRVGIDQTTNVWSISAYFGASVQREARSCGKPEASGFGSNPKRTPRPTTDLLGRRARHAAGRLGELAFFEITSLRDFQFWQNSRMSGPRRRVGRATGSLRLGVRCRVDQCSPKTAQ